MKRRNRKCIVDRFSETTIRLATSSPERMKEFEELVVERMRNAEHLYNCHFHIVDTFKENGFYYYVYEEFDIGDE